MKKLLTILTLAGALLVAGSAYAVVDVDITAVYTMPTGDFGDNYDDGFGVGGDFFVGLPFFPIEVGGHVGYNRFGATEEKYIDSTMTIIEIMPSVRYVLGPPLSPVKVFGQVGVGLYNWKSELELDGIPIVSTKDGSDFGISIGAGVKGQIGPLVGLFAMPMYHIIMTEDENTTYLSLNAGILF